MVTAGMTISEPFGPAPARPKRNLAMPIAIALALSVHVSLITGLGLRIPEWGQRQGNTLELMVITQPGLESSAAVTAVVAAQADRSGETSALLPELDDSTSSAIESQALESTDVSAQPADDLIEPTNQANAEDTEAVAPLSAPLEQPPNPDLRPLEAALPRQVAPATAAQPPLIAASPEPEIEAASVKAIDATTPLSAQSIEPPKQTRISAADIFASRNAEMANLAARIQAESSAYANRSRRKAISTATREYVYANYMEAWRRKVERIGNLNYPSEARELGLFGSLILHVAVRADGSLEGIRVVRSSGHDVLDDAAIRIVELAAPFSPFPPNIKRETDVLDITRTWQFQRNNQLGWDN